LLREAAAFQATETTLSTRFLQARRLVQYMRVLLSGVVVAVATTLRGLRHSAFLEAYTFEDYERDFQRNYTEAERVMRKQIVESNLQFVRKVNSNPGQSWTAGVNELTDKTEDEFASQFTGLSVGMRLGGSGRGALLTHKANRTNTTTLADRRNAKVPPSMDWRKHNAVTPVMRQGACGSCWAVAAAGALEAQLARKSGRLRRVAAGALRDCVSNPRECGGQGGCKGAIAQLAYSWATRNGVVFEDDYKYTEYDGECRARDVGGKGRIAGYEQLPRNDAESLMEALAFEGPVTVSVAVPAAFRSYFGGVIKCGDEQGTSDWKISHAVLAVGYGTDPAHGPYWLVKNSWGGGWGEDGYIRIARARDPEEEPCGTDVAPELGFSCKPYPKSLKVCGHCGILSDSSYPIV